MYFVLLSTLNRNNYATNRDNATIHDELNDESFAEMDEKEMAGSGSAIVRKQIWLEGVRGNVPQLSECAVFSGRRGLRRSAQE